MTSATFVTSRYQTGERHFQDLFLDSASFVGRDLSGASFRGCDLDNVDFTGANLSDVEFSHCRFLRTNFARANLKGVSFEYSERFAPRGLDSANVEGVDLRQFGENLQSSDTVGIAALLRIEAKGDAAKLACVQYIEDHASAYCWEGFVDHFKRTNPRELLWGLRTLKKYSALHDYAAHYEAGVLAEMGDDEDTVYDAGVLTGKVATGQEVIYSDYYGGESVRKVSEVRPSGIIVLDAAKTDSVRRFMPDGNEIATRSRGSISLLTDEKRQELEKASLLRTVIDADWHDMSLATLKAVKAVIEATAAK